MKEGFTKKMALHLLDNFVTHAVEDGDTEGALFYAKEIANGSLSKTAN